MLSVSFRAIACCLPVAVHFFIVVLVFTVNDRLPPGLVIKIPANRLLDAVFKHSLGQPSKLIMDLGGIDRVAHIMSLAICHISDQALRFAKFFADQFDDMTLLYLRIKND